MAPSDSAVPARAWQVVLERIEADLVAGRVGPGDRLPPERELSVQLGVGRSSVREALRVLEVMGLIRTGTGSGPTSGAIVIATPTGGMASFLRLQVAAQSFPLEDVVATRLVLEQAVARAVAWAVAAHGDGQLAASRDVLSAMEDADLTPAEFLALDAQFHLTLAQASGNVVIEAMMAGLRTAIEGYVLDAAEQITDWDATTERLRAEHRGILSAVEAGDADAAASRVHDHITGYYTRARLARS
jgi:DNA-binding FadR family transcriptional regulator